MWPKLIICTLSFHPTLMDYLGVVYTMVHEVLPRPCKICDWLLNSSRDHFCSHQGENVRVTMEFEVPKRHILRPTLSTDMIQWVLRWERQKGVVVENRHMLVGKKCCYYIFLMKSLFGRRKWRQENGQTWIFPWNCPFWTYIKKNISTFTFWCMVIPLGSHLIYT